MPVEAVRGRFYPIHSFSFLFLFISLLLCLLPSTSFTMYFQDQHLRSHAAPLPMDHDRDLAAEEAGHETHMRGALNEKANTHQSLLHHQHQADSNPATYERPEETEYNPTSLSDIIEGLPTAVKCSLGPLMTIRRSVSIRSWVSYIYEISTNNAVPREGRAERHTLVSTSTTTEVEMKQQGGGAHQSNQGQKRRRASTHSTRTSTEVVEHVEPYQRMEIDRFCGLQGKPEPTTRAWRHDTAQPPPPPPARFTFLSFFPEIVRFSGFSSHHYRNAGQLLVNNALSDSRPPSAQGYGSGDRNERRAYVQGLAWLMQGLPDDLDAGERSDLMRAMPGTLLDEMSRRSGGGGGGSGRRLGPPGNRGASAAQQRTLIQRVVAALVVRLVGPLQFLWTHLLLLLTMLAQMERKYKVTELVVRHSGELGYTVGKRGVKLSGTIYKHGGARVGAVVTDAAAYVADGLVKGIGDGIREACLELREAESP